MKLYNIDHSPYATRVRMQIRKKNLDVEILPPPVPLRTPEFIAHFPMGKLPVLELDDGQQVAESWVIMEYLEDVFPEPALRPTEALARAQMGMLARCADTHLGPQGLFPLFARTMVPGGTEGAQPLLESLDGEIDRVQRLLGALPDYRERGLHLGDIALVPPLAYVELVAPAFGRENPLAGFPGLQAWWEWVQSDEAVAATTAEMVQAFHTFMAALKGD